MKTISKRVISCVAALTLLITCALAGLAVPVAANDNLLVNGDFEEDGANWGTDTGVSFGGDYGKDGESKGLKIETTIEEGAASHAQPGVYYKGDFNALLEPNTTYIFSFDYKNEGVGFGEIAIVNKGSDWTGWSNISSLTATTWTHVDVEFTTGAEGNMSSNKGFEVKARRTHYKTVVGSGATYYDNFKLEKKVVVPLTGVSLNKTAATIEMGQANQLKVNFTPAEAAPPVVQWSSSDETVATVSATGLVETVAEGSATITATVAGFDPLTCAVTVVAAENMLTNGDFENGNTSWQESADVSIADGNGKDGTVGLKIETTVDASTASHQQPGIYYNGDFNGILEPHTTYIFSFDYKNEGVGFGEIAIVNKGSDWTGWSNISSLTATDWTHVEIEFTTGAAESMNTHKNYEWKVRRTHYKTVEGSGTTWFDNFKLVEKPYIPLTSVSLNKTATTVEAGRDNQLKVKFQPAEAAPPLVQWVSSDETVATVSATGVVTGVAEGTVTITATVAGFDPMTCTVTVVSAENLMVNGDFETYNTGWQEKPEAQIADGNGKDGTVGLKFETTVAEGDAHQTPGIYYQSDFNGLLEENSIYTFSFDYKNEGEGFGQLYIVRSGSDWTGGWVNTNLTATEWTHHEITFTTGAAQNIDVHKNFEWLIRRVQYNSAIGSGTTYYDNFKLVKVGTVQYADEIYITPDGLELFPMDSGNLGIGTVPVDTAKGIVTWESSDPETVSVDQEGKVTALKSSGSVTITATNNKGKSDTCTVTITENANLIKNGDFELGGKNWDNLPNVKYGIGRDGGYGFEMTHSGTGNWTSYYYKGSLVGLLEPGTTYEFSVDYLRIDEESEARIWTLSMGVSTGVADFKVSDEWQTYTKKFTTPTDLEMRTGWDLSLVCETTGETPVVLDNISIRKYSSGVAAESIRLNYEKLTLIPGRTGALTASAYPLEADLNDMTWTSSDDNVATVEYGVVTGVGKGTATITGTTKNGKSASCVVTVSGNETLIGDGSFDTADHSAWTLAGGATIADGEGRVGSDAVALVTGSTAAQSFGGVKADTTYQFSFRYRSNDGASAAVVTMTNGTATLLNETTDKTGLWKTAKYEFTTAASVEDATTVTFTADGASTVYIDNVLLSVKASLVDLVVNEVVYDTSSQVKPGTEVLFAAAVENQGSDKLAIGTKITVELRKNGEVFRTLEHTLQETMEQGTIAIVVADEPWIAEEGDWVISACANPDLAILEMNDANNTEQISLRVSDTILEAPEQAKAFNMTELVFSDEFDSYDSIDMYATGRDGYKWYVTRTWYSTITPEDYTVENGVLKLHQRNAEDASITLSSVDAVTGVGWDYNFGYLEARLRIPNPTYCTDGAKPAIWSFPTTKWLQTEGENSHWVEMDWLEYWGRDLERWPQYPDGYYTVTLHDQIVGRSEEEDHWLSNGNAYCNGLGDGEWHVMGWLWTYNGVIAYIDGVEVFRISYDENELPSAMVSHHYGDLDHTGAFSYMNEQDLMLYIAGTMESPLELDYIRVWRGADASSMPDDDDDDDKDDNISITPDSFWLNYGTDAYGDAITEVTYDNYQSVLDGEELWNAMTDDAKAEINKLFTDNGQPTFDELLAAAKAMKEKVDSGWTPVDWDAINAQAEDFVWYYLSDVDGNPITEVTEDNYEYILDSVAEWDTLDDLVKQAIEDLLKENGQPTYAELVKAAMAVALENGWTEDELPDFDFGDDETDTPETDTPETDTPETDTPETDAPETDTPETDDSVGGDESEGGEGEGDEPEAEDPSETGATSALPVVLAMVMMLAGAALVFARKRETE